MKKSCTMKGVLRISSTYTATTAASHRGPYTRAQPPSTPTPTPSTADTALNPSVNAYRRLDPHFEAPNQIKASAINRGAMVRIPVGNERSTRIEVRSVGPDANPYAVIYSIFRTGLEGPLGENAESERKSRTRFLPDNVYDAIRLFKSSAFSKELYGETVHTKFAVLSSANFERSW